MVFGRYIYNSASVGESEWRIEGHWDTGIFGLTEQLAKSPLWSKNLLYPLVNEHSYGKSPFLLGKLTMHGHFQ